MTLTQRDAYALIHNGSAVLAQVEANGIRIDTDYLKKAISKTRRQINHVTDRIKNDKIFELWRKIYGQKTNMGSKEQLGKILFEHMEIECTHHTPTGRPSITESSLEGLNLQFTKDIVRLEKLKKTASTYLKGIKREVVDGFIHPFFNLHTTRTYRSSSSEPNFQNIPARNPEMKRIVRRCFIPREGHVLIESDYGRLEVCVSACYHKDPAMIRYIKDKTMDMHRDLASKCFMIPNEEVSRDARLSGKGSFVFAQFYGDFYGHCANNMWKDMIRMELSTNSGDSVRDILRQHGIDRLGDCAPKGDPVPGTFAHHLRNVERWFWKNKFKQYDAWKRTWWNAYERRGHFTTLTGFKIRGDYNRKEVSNYPIQGSGFHCLLWTLICLQEELRKRKMKAKIVGQIHDCILSDVPVEEVDEYVEITNRIATEDIRRAWRWIIVPLEMEFESCPEGGSWYDKKLMEV